MEFLSNSCSVKIKHETICNDFHNGGLKNVDKSRKISSLQCSWVKKLYNQNSCNLKLFPMHFINNAFWKNFIFNSNLSFIKLLYCIGFLLFKQTFFNDGKETFLTSLTLLVLQDPNFYGLIITLELTTILFTLQNFRATI